MGLFTWRELPKWILGVVLLALIAYFAASYKERHSIDARNSTVTFEE